MKLIGRFYLIFALLLTASCGFHLRGVLDMPRWLNNVTIEIQNAHRHMGSLLSDQLRAYHINVIPDPSLADYWLIIAQDDFQQQISSISSSTTPRQYQLIYTVQFKLQRAKGKEVMPLSKVVVTRQITLNSDRILGSTNEEDQSKQEMRRDAAIQIIDRLSRVHE